MKKIYFAPETEIVEVALDTLMQPASLNGDANENSVGFSRESDWEE